MNSIFVTVLKSFCVLFLVIIFIGGTKYSKDNKTDKTDRSVGIGISLMSICTAVALFI